jgi:hypothetical protein
VRYLGIDADDARESLNRLRSDRHRHTSDPVGQGVAGLQGVFTSRCPRG